MSHICSECDFTTKWSYNFRRHFIRVHEGVDTINASKDTPNASKDTPVASKDTLNKNQCNKCDKILTRHTYLKSHLEKCKGKINKLQCDICNEIFSCPPHKYRHQKNCKIKKEKEEQQKVIIQNQTINNITNNITNITNNNITIQLNDFEALNSLIEHVTPEKEDECSEKGYPGVCDMIGYIYFNPEYPKNHNIKLISIKHGTIQIYTKNNWELRSLLEISERLFKRVLSMLISRISFDKIFEDLDVMYAFKRFYRNILKSTEPRKTDVLLVYNYIKGSLIQRKNENENSNLLQ